MRNLRRWVPTVIFGMGSLLVLTIDGQRHLELRGDLSTAVPTEILGFTGRDGSIPEREVEIVGVDSYLFRAYRPGTPAAIPGFTLYIGYYGSQSQGRTIHSPKNCLPGNGWETLHSREVTIAAGGEEVLVNRYLLQKGSEQALVLYWYQGRGRVEANEFRVKLDLLRDSALLRRSDEALVRIVVPITSSEEQAFEAAVRIAEQVVPSVYEALPA